MRMDQYRGLNDWARKTVLKKEKARVTGTMTFTSDGRQRRFTRWARIPVAKVEHIGKISGAYKPCVAKLRRFTMPDGTVYVEYVQESPWSGGPVYHTALKNAATGEPVAESLWTREELDHC